MKRGKYNNETVMAIYRAISLTGKDSDGWKAGGISKETFYRWLKLKSDFSDIVARARAFYKRRLWRDDPEVYDLAVKGLIKHLRGCVEQWTFYDNEGKLTKKTIIRRPPSKWAVERLLDVNPGGDGEIEGIEWVELK